MSKRDETRPVSRPWSDEETRYLISHKRDGADLIAIALGRTRASVKVKACRLRVSLQTEFGEICPRCGRYRIRRGTGAARHGLCQVCWELEKAGALRERRAFVAARQEYERVKKRATP